MDGQWFGDVRSLLAEEPSEARWEALCELLGDEAMAKEAEEWLPYVSGLLEERWARSLRVAPRSWIDAALRGSPPAGWSLVRGVELEGHISGDRRLMDLVERGFFKPLTHISLARCELTSVGLEALLEATSGRLVALDLTGNPLEDWSTFGNKHLDRLRRLDLTRCRLTARGFEGLYCGSAVDGVQELIIDENPNISHIDDVSGWMAKIGCTMERLESLSMRGCEERGAWLHALRDDRALERLRRLDVSNNPLQDDGLKLLAEGAMPQLTQLYLNHAQLSDEGARLLAAAPWASQLDVLELDGNALGEEGLAALAKSAKLKPALRYKFGATDDEALVWAKAQEEL